VASLGSKKINVHRIAPLDTNKICPKRMPSMGTCHRVQLAEFPIQIPRVKEWFTVSIEALQGPNAE
jgi:hypothetical protein